MKKKILPPVYLFACLVAMPLLHFLLPVKSIIPVPYNLAGVVFIAAGIWLNLWADRLFQKYKTTVKPFEQPVFLIDEGPFKFTRNPMYLGMVLILTGIAALFGTVTVFIVPAIYLIIMDFVFIREEEKSLQEAFGIKFTEYKTRVRRWI